MKTPKNEPQKIVVCAGSYCETRNSIEETLHVVKHLLQAGTIVIEIENVTAKIALTEKILNA